MKNYELGTGVKKKSEKGGVYEFYTTGTGNNI
jgi:hypothetical protein